MTHQMQQKNPKAARPPSVFTTSEAGRKYVADFFVSAMRRHDFTRYINDRLAADFACALADGLYVLQSAQPPRLSAEVEPVADAMSQFEALKSARLAHAAGEINTDELRARLDAIFGDDEPPAVAQQAEPVALALALAVPATTNRNGLDTPYFVRWLNRVVPALENYTPAEFAREFGRMAAAADKEALLADQLPAVPAPPYTLTSENPIYIDGKDIALLAEFAGVDNEDQDGPSDILLWVGEHTDDDGKVGYGLNAALAEYPEEGCLPLTELGKQPSAVAMTEQEITTLAVEHFEIDYDRLPSSVYSFARALLSAKPPAVAQQQAEPVADEFFAYDPECGFETFKNAAEAKQYAQDSIDSYRDEAAEGWPEEVENVCWGVVLGGAKEIRVGEKDDGSGDWYADYVLTDAAQPPAVAVPDGWRDAVERAAEDLEDNNCLESAHQLRAMLAAAPHVCQKGGAA